MPRHNSIIHAKEFNPEKITFGTPRALDSGGKSISIFYDGAPLIIQTPRMAIPFGISRWSNDKNSAVPDKLSLELSFKGKESRPRLEGFMDALLAMDKQLLQAGLDNSFAWFKKAHTKLDVVEALYTPLVRFAKDKDTGEVTDKYPPNLRATLPHVEGRVSCEVFNAARDPVPDVLSLDLKGSQATAIIQCNGIWVAGGKFGCSWKVVQLRVEPQAGINGFAFRDLEDSDAEEGTAPGEKRTSRRMVDNDAFEDDGNDCIEPNEARKPITRAPVILADSDEDEDDLELSRARRGVVKVVG